MTAVKIAISLPEHLVAKAKRGIRAGQAKTMSGYVASAIEQKADPDDLRRMLDEMLAETGGPLTAAEKRRVDRELGLVGRRPRRKKAR
jgi:hypothetical protein